MKSIFALVAGVLLACAFMVSFWFAGELFADPLTMLVSWGFLALSSLGAFMLCAHWDSIGE